MAKKLGRVEVLNGVVYNSVPKKIGHNQIAVPSAFWKMIYNKKEKFEKCFYFENNPLFIEHKNSIRDFVVDCGSLVRRKNI